MISPSTYRGRFAPSPTGPLHFGSLIAAVGSYLQARVQQGEWLVRMEDIDEPRSVAGADREILQALQRLDMPWDGDVVYQTRRHALYERALQSLLRAGHAFPCACSRREVGGGIYPGTCRNGLAAGRQARSIRLRVPTGTFGFQDPVQGPFQQDLAREVGDFVIRRADGLFAYQLAVVVDDADQHISEVMRGSDLLDSTPRQLLLAERLALKAPGFVHLPVAVNERGEKLSKQTHASPLALGEPARELCRALDFLGHLAPDRLRRAPLHQIWSWARDNWRLERVPREMSLPA